MPTAGRGAEPRLCEHPAATASLDAASFEAASFDAATVFHVAAHVRWIDHDDGPALLDLRAGKYLAVNVIGGLVWQEIERRQPHGEILRRLRERFPEISAARLQHDVEAFLSQLIDRQIIARAEGGPEAPSASLPLTLEQFVAAGDFESYRGSHQVARLRFAAFWLMVAYVALILADLYLQGRGFARFHAALARLPVRTARAPRTDLAAALAATVDQAAAYYFKRAWCLQRSAVTLTLMRLRGLPAELVIGVRRLPFGAHAWIEIDQQVVNDHPAIRQVYQVIERC